MKKMKISAVVNTHNEEENIARCLSAVAPFVNEIVVVDTLSSDATVSRAKKFTDKIWTHHYVGYVEPARNYALKKATGDWILLIDADEVLPAELGRQLTRLVGDSRYSFYRIPRRNLIFGKWLGHSGWWPDYQIRLFARGSVSWSDEIHSLPLTSGQGMDLPADDQHALRHYHYESVDKYLARLNRYTTQEARQLMADGYRFRWQNVIGKPTGEFLARFFAWEGYKDGLHGLVLSLLQAFSFLVVELKAWESERFRTEVPPRFLDKVTMLFGQARRDFCYWYFQTLAKRSTGIRKIVYKTRAKLRL